MGEPRYARSVRMSQLHQSMNLNSTMKIYQLEYKSLLVLHDFYGEAHDELTCATGTELCGITNQDGWWLARRRNDKILGLIPESFVQVVPSFPSDSRSIPNSHAHHFQAISSQNPGFQTNQTNGSSNYQSSSIAESSDEDYDPSIATRAEYISPFKSYGKQFDVMPVLKERSKYDSKYRKQLLILSFFLVLVVIITGAGVGTVLTLNNTQSVIQSSAPTIFGATLTPTLNGNSPGPVRVVCRFNILSAVEQLYIGGVDVTSEINGDLENVFETKEIEFEDNLGPRVVFAILGKAAFIEDDDSEICVDASLAAFQLKCVSDRPSRWNFDTNTVQWVSIPSRNPIIRDFVEDWFLLNPTQSFRDTVSSTANINIQTIPAASPNSRIWAEPSLPGSCTPVFNVFRRIIG